MWSVRSGQTRKPGDGSRASEGRVSRSLVRCRSRRRPLFLPLGPVWCELPRVTAFGKVLSPAVGLCGPVR